MKRGLLGIGLLLLAGLLGLLGEELVLKGASAGGGGGYWVRQVGLASLGTADLAGNGVSQNPDGSGDGRFYVFESTASDLIANDTNQWGDIFLYEQPTGTVTRLSQAADGGETNGPAYNAVISADGRFVAFETEADNVAADDTNGFTDIALYDRQTGTMSLASRAEGGELADGGSFNPALSGDGRFLAFSSLGRNLSPDDTNLYLDIYLRDLISNTTTLVTRGLNGAPVNNSSYMPSLSRDGRYIAFFSDASNLVSNDANEQTDIFVYDRQSGATTRISLGPGGQEANGSSYVPEISGDGRFVVFLSAATNLVAQDNNAYFDVFRWARDTGQVSLISTAVGGGAANGDSLAVEVSADGRYLALVSDANNLVTNDLNPATDVFRFDLSSGERWLVSQDNSGNPANGAALVAVVNDTGDTLMFDSQASNLDAADQNGLMDLFISWPVFVPFEMLYLPVVLHEYPPVYTISGEVQTGDGLPVPGVTIATANGQTAVTDSNGRYTLTRLLAGTYTLTPTLAGYTWNPATRTVSVPPAQVGQDFTAVPLATVTPTPSATPTATPSATPPACGDVVLNGGFEAQTVWQIGQTVYPAAYDTAVPHSGAWAMRIGIVNPNDNLMAYSSAWQIVTIPGNATAATLDFWLYPVSTGLLFRPTADFRPPLIGREPLTDDAQYVLVYDQNGTQHTLWYARANDQAWGGHRFDLTSFAGQSVQLYFGVYNNGFGGVTGLYVDDVSLQTCAP